jgi:hypothetical protein
MNNVPYKTKSIGGYQRSHIKQTTIMPKDLENKLKKEYGKNSDVPYKIMNKMGVMRGNKETPKGKAMESRHQVDKNALKVKRYKRV